jgi:branched-chain amino acid transport system permease protein
MTVDATTPRKGIGRLGPLGTQKWAVGLVVVVVVLFPLLFGADSYTMSIATQCLIYGLVVVTLNLLIGFGGQISLGHAGLLAVGAYTAAILATRIQGLFLPLEIVAAAVVTAIVGFVLGLPTGRLRGHYLAIATLGFGIAVPQIALNLEGLTEGFTGLSMPPATLVGLDLSSPVSLYYLVAVVCALALGGILSLLSTSTGRRFMAVRDSEDAASAMGINVRTTKVVLFTTSAFFTGIAGDLFAHFQSLVAPSSFPFSLSLFFLAAVVVGGLASVWGSLAGAVLLVIVEAQTSSLGGLGPAIIGGTVVCVLLVSPDGLAGLSRHLWRTLRSRGQTRSHKQPAAQESSQSTEIERGT